VLVFKVLSKETHWKSIVISKQDMTLESMDMYKLFPDSVLNLARWLLGITCFEVNYSKVRFN